AQASSDVADEESGIEAHGEDPSELEAHGSADAGEVLDISSTALSSEEDFEDQARGEQVVATEESTDEDVALEAAHGGDASSLTESEATAAPLAESHEGAGTESESEEEVKKAGPKVLGKISLPQASPKKPEKKKEAKKFRSTTSSGESEEEDDSDQGRKGKRDARKRNKRQEFSRTDLVDYEGLPGRRGTKTKKLKRKQDEEEDAVSTTEITTPKASKRVVKIDQVVTVGDLANQMSLKAAEIISKLIELGIMATINQVLDLDTATIVAEEFEFTVESTSFDEEVILKVEDDPEDSLKPRPPVVTVMGHVDHGKTSLLDRIRATSVVDKEHGGITQHIGAYSVSLPDGRAVTFIDTPGHAAFTAMRARGAHVTDIVILVVAADDGVMPQTLEAIDHSKAAGVPIVVAVNKMDKPDANPDKVKQQLAERGLQPEDWGGDIMFFPVSAKTGLGIEEMLEGLLLQAEVAELKANPDRKAVGTIIESRQDKGRGTVATVLIQRGTLNVGDIYVTGGEYGRVRSMMNHTGAPTESVSPSFPVEITGLSGVPEAGDDFIVVDSESQARQVAAHRAELKRKKEAGALGSGPISLEEFARQATMAKAVELNIIVKADVHGSLEAVKESVSKLATDKVRVQV
ncbi:MAG: translation initiation factor IF-2, partial [Bdellovibrionales bacterium]|nr:translation initiation factor IF-2 [Bdellovibrionales bacterium]